MSWSHLSLVTDGDIGELEPEAVHGDSPWGATAWPSQRSAAKRDLKVWLEADYPHIPAVTDRIKDRWRPDWVYAETSSAWTDYTTAARDDTEEDIPLASVFATFSTDALYVGANYEFDGVLVQLLDSLSATTSALSVSYWGPTGWTALTVADGTSVAGKTFAQSGRVTWTVPSQWERRRLNGTADEFFWIKLTVSAALTAGTSASHVLPLRSPDGLKRVAAYLAVHHIYQGLAAQAATPADWREQADKYLSKAETLYARLREHGGIPIDYDNDGTITPPTETTVVSSPRLYRG